MPSADLHPTLQRGYACVCFQFHSFIFFLQCTHTAAPNFALDLTVRKFLPSLHSRIPPLALAAAAALPWDPPLPAPLPPTASSSALPLSLASLECLLNAAEPIRVSSLEKWNAAFQPYGWSPAAMCPCYGLAEHVVGVAGWGSKVSAGRAAGVQRSGDSSDLTHVGVLAASS